MSFLKRPGCCSACDAEVFDVRTRDKETRAPVALGAPLDNAVRATFVLFMGSQMSLTLCSDCAAALTPADFPILWQRVMAGWIAKSGTDHPWARSQADNGIVGLLHMRPWKEVINGSC